MADRWRLDRSDEYMDLVIVLLIGFIAGVIATVEWALCASDKRKEGKKDDEI